MNLSEHIYSVLIVSSSEKLNQSFQSLLEQSRFNPVSYVSDTANAGRCLLENNYDIVIINTPLPDDFGVRLAIDTVNAGSTGVLLLVKSEHFTEVNTQVSAYGVLTLQKPTTT